MKNKGVNKKGRSILNDYKKGSAAPAVKTPVANKPKASATPKNKKK